MDDFLKNNNNAEPAEEEKKIEFKFVRVKGKSKTQVRNLMYYIADDKKRNTILKNMKTAFGTACCAIKDVETGEFVYEFNGDFTIKITDYLINNQLLSKNAFK